MPSFLRGLAENWKLKALAFGLAVLLWIVVSAEQVTSAWIPVPLDVNETDSSYRLVSGGIPREVEVRFLGPGRELWDLVIRRPPLVLDVSDVRASEQAFPLDPHMVRIPNQLAVSAQDVRPALVRLHFTRLETHTVPVGVDLRQGPDSGFVLVDSLSVVPASIRVTGPSGRLAAVRTVSTQAISLAGVDSAFSRVVPLDTTGLSGLDLSVSRVRVRGEVDRLAERVLTDVPISLGPGVRVRPAGVSVALRGPAGRVRRLRDSDFRVVVSIDSIPDVVPPSGVPVPLAVEGLPPGVRATLQPARVLLLPARLPADSAQLQRPRVRTRPVTPRGRR